MASIQCGNCKATHASVREVRDCYGHVAPSVQAEQGSIAASNVPATPSSAPQATPKQMKFIETLLEQRKNDFAPFEHSVWDEVRASKKAASRIIEELMKLPVRAQAVKMKGALPVVPEGRYAVQDGQKLRFVKVQRPTEGKWAGYTFMKEQASEELFPVRGERMKTLLAMILEQGVDECLARYGQELGVCGKCGRTLTDETSRKLGLGPVCRAA